MAVNDDWIIKAGFCAHGSVQNHKKEPCGTALVQLQIHVRQHAAGSPECNPGTLLRLLEAACAKVASKSSSNAPGVFSSDKNTQADLVGISGRGARVLSASSVNMRIQVTSAEHLR